MANPSEEPIVDRGPYYRVARMVQDLEQVIEAQRADLLQKDTLNTELQLELANSRAVATRFEETVKDLLRTIDDQAHEIATCKVLKYEEILDEMDQFFCTAYDEDEPVTCGWRHAILRMREIRNG